MNIRLAVLYLCILVIGFAACKKNDDAPVVKQSAGLNVINASADTVNIYLNGTRLNYNSNIYPGSATAYLTVTAGTQAYQVKKAFNLNTSVVQPLFSVSVKLDSNTYNSLFIASEKAEDAFVTRDILLVDDSTNTCLVRFVNASTEPGTMSMSLGDTTQFQNQSFKDASEFVLVGISGKKTLKVYQNGNTTTPIYQNTVALLAGKSYTFFTKGLLSGKGTAAFGVGSTVNVN